jgi:hypothetical protein
MAGRKRVPLGFCLQKFKRHSICTLSVRARPRNDGISLSQRFLKMNTSTGNCNVVNSGIDSCVAESLPHNQIAPTRFERLRAVTG